MMSIKPEKLSFKPRARLLLLLGDQLIRSPEIAVFELVKNAYDADSPDVVVTMEDIENPEKGKIIIKDSGIGMDYETVKNVWLEPGTDYRKKQKEAGERTPIHHRLPLGEKGVGRFAVHKLGKHVVLVTRKLDLPETVVKIDWDEFDEGRYLSDVMISVTEREPIFFKGDRTGTRIEVTHLSNSWNKTMVRNLARAVNSISSPFDMEGDFKVDFRVPGNPDWLENLLTVGTVLEYALFIANCRFSADKFSYTYQFTPYPAMDKLKPRTESREFDAPKKVNLESLQKEVGDFELDLYIFDREPAVLQLGVTDRSGLKKFLDANGGVRVYRDGIRVYDYGEQENDWLDIDARRVNIPASRISNNIVIGAALINLETSTGLIEKTNREGFVENEALQAFKEAIIYMITQVEAERNKDKERIRIYYGRSQPNNKRESVLEDLAILRQELEQKGLEKELGYLINRIEADFILIRDRFLTSASTGLSLSVVIHEVEKGIAELKKAVEQEPTSENLKSLAKHLADLVEGFAALIKRSGMSREKASSLIQNALFNTRLRLKVHGISAIVDPQLDDFEVKCSKRLVISTLMNLIDNSIWWLDNKWGQTSRNKKIYIDTTRNFSLGHAIVLADNGPGFIDPPEYLIEPFVSRKPDGMGLGLHLADQVMRAQGGRLVFPGQGDMDIPKEFDGAIVALVFKEG